MKKKFLYLLSFIVPVIVFLVIATITDFLPFGKKMLVVYDAYFEYSTFLAELGDILRNGKSIFYTLRGGMGVNFYSILNLYCGSPLNLLTVFFKRENIYIFYTLMIYLKVGLAGLSMYIYLNSLDTKYKDTIWNLVFSSIYALSGYVLAFNMHLMWMDAYIMLPLIIKGLDSLILKNKHIYYVLMLAIMMIVNYYMAFKICIFLSLYFIYKSIIENKLSKKTIMRFMGYSCLAAGMAAFVLIPTYFNLKSGRLGNIDISELFKIDWRTLFSLPYNLTMGSFLVQDNYDYGTNTIFVTLFIVVLVIYFFFNNKISKKDKIVTGSILLFYIISFSVSFIDYAWNMLQRPVWWSHRYQFTLIFFLIVVAYNSFLRLDISKVDKKKISLVSIIFFIILLGSFSYKILGYKLPDKYFYIFMISISCMFIYMFFMKSKKLFILLILLEVCVNGVITLNTNLEYDYKDYRNYLVNTINELSVIEDLDDYKINYLPIKFSENAGFIVGFNSLELFSSSYNGKYRNTMEKLNLAEGETNHIVINQNPVLGSIVGVKYYYGNDYFGYFECNGNICVDKNAMPYVYSVPNNFKDILLGDDYVENVNKIYSALVEEKIEIMEHVNVLDLIKYNGLIDDGSDNFVKDYIMEIEYKANKREMLYFDDSKIYLSDSVVKINENTIGELNSKKLLVLDKGDTLSIHLDGESLANSDVYSGIEKFDEVSFSIVDLSLYENVISSLSEKAHFVKLDNKSLVINGKINADSQLLFINIPYDEGLKIFIGGREARYFKLLDAFVGVNVKEGIYDIDIKYVPKGFEISLVVSVISLIIFGGISLKKYYNIIV